MQSPIQVSFRHLAYSPYIAKAVRERASSLEKFYERIIALRVMVEPSQRRRSQGNLYHIRIQILVPGGELVVKRDPPKHQAHEDIYVAIRDAFDAARRQLEDYTRCYLRRKQRHHEAPARAKVLRLFPREDYGFLGTPDGREIYFHKNSVLNHEFDKMQVGEEVRFSEERGDDGPQASTVRRAG